LRRSLAKKDFWASDARKLKTRSLVERKPPKLLAQIEYMAKRTKGESDNFELKKRTLTERINRLRERSDSGRAF